MTRGQKVLAKLIEARQDNRPFLLYPGPPEEWISGGYLPMWAFRGPQIGGDAADVRLRELRREHLVPIELHNHKTRYGTTPLYRLDMTQEQTIAYDWEPALKQPFTWKYEPIKTEEKGQIEGF